MLRVKASSPNALRNGRLSSESKQRLAGRREDERGGRNDDDGATWMPPHVYAILRHNGVGVGKRDCLGTLSKREAS